MTSPSTLLELGGSHYVSLTTFRRSGEEVSTPVWVARDADALVIMTSASSGKVKRLRNNAAVALRPCSPSGKVKEGAPRFVASAEILGSAQQEQRRADLVKRKYGLEYRAFKLVERVIELIVRRGRREEWVILRLTPPLP